MRHPSNRTETPLFRLFVYGTLKRGYWNHERFCGDAISIEEATVCGKLYELPSGIPALDVAQGSVLAEGSSYVVTDLRTQDMFASEVHGLAWSPISAGWAEVRGELITFSDPENELPPIDRLEGFRPGIPSLYRRVLVLTRTESGHVVPAWTFVLGLDADQCTLNPLEGANEWNLETR